MGDKKLDVEYWWRIVQYEAQELDKARTLKEARAKKKRWEEKFPSSTVAIWDATGHQIECVKNKIGMDEEMKKRVEKCLNDLKEIGKILERGGIIWLKR